MAWTIGSSNCKASTEAEIWIFIPAAPNAWKAILLLFKKSPSARSLSEGYPIPDEVSSRGPLQQAGRITLIGLDFSIAEISLPRNAYPLPLGEVRCLLDTLDPIRTTKLSSGHLNTKLCRSGDVVSLDIGRASRVLWCGNLPDAAQRASPALHQGRQQQAANTLNCIHETAKHRPRIGADPSPTVWAGFWHYAPLGDGEPCAVDLDL